MNLKALSPWLPLLLVAACTSEPVAPLPPAPVITAFTATPDAVPVGGSVTLSWEVQDASSLALLDGAGVAVGSGLSTTAGTLVVQVREPSLFVLVARNSRGVKAAASASVDVEGFGARAFLTVVPARVRAGEPVTLAWSAPGLAPVSITEAGGAALDLKGQVSGGTLTLLPQKDTTWTLTAPGATASASVQLSPSIVSFEVAAAALPDGGQGTVLAWQTRNATGVRLTSPGRGTLLETAQASAVAQGTFEDALPLLPSGARVPYVLTATGSGEPDSREVANRFGAPPQVLSVTAPATVKAGTPFTLAWTTVGAQSVVVLAAGVELLAAASSQVAAGSVELQAPAARTVYAVRATSREGKVAQQSVTVEPVGPPTLVSFTATPSTIANGGELVSLEWNVAQARRVTVREVGGTFSATRSVEADGGTPEVGSVRVYPNQPSVTYRLEADNGVGDAIAPRDVAVTVTTPARLVLGPPAPLGGTVALTGHTVVGGTDLLLPPQFVDIATSGNPGPSIGPDFLGGAVTLTTPLQTTFFGAPLTVTTVAIYPNGFIVLNGTGAGQASTDSTFDYAAFEELPPLSLAPFYADLTLTGGTTRWQRDTFAGQERLIVQWNTVRLDLVTASQLTFQVQLLANGEVSFQYRTFNLAGARPAYGIGLRGPAGSMDVFLAGPPVEGGTLSPSGGGTPVTLPLQVSASAAPLRAAVRTATGGLVFVEGQTLLPTRLALTEAMPRPAPSLSGAEWVKLRNYGTDAVDLGGFSLLFSNAGAFTFDAGTVLAPDASVLAAQSADLGDPDGGVFADLAYGPGLLLPRPDAGTVTTAAGAVSLVYGTATHSTLRYTRLMSLDAGVSQRSDPPRSDAVYATGFTQSSCVSDFTGGTFGSLPQQGTPGAPTPLCLPYAVSTVPGTFQALGPTGGTLLLAGAASSSDNANLTLALPFPVRLFSAQVSTVSINSNGFLTPFPLLATALGNTNKVVPSASSPSPGTVAPFWDDLEGQAAPESGIFWKAFDPDGTAGTGDESVLISWEKWRFASTTVLAVDLNFQVRLSANGTVEYQYGTMQSVPASNRRGLSATSWLEDTSGTSALRINLNSVTPGITPNSGVRFTPAP